MENAQTDAEDKTASLAAFIKKTQTESLVHNSDIAEHQQKLKALRLELQDHEAEMIRHDEDAKDDKRQLGEINMAIHNIYGRCRSKGPPPEAERAEDALLEVIQQRVTDLGDIVAGYDRHLKAAAAASAAAAAAAAAAQSTGTSALPGNDTGGPVSRKSTVEPSGVASRAPDKSATASSVAPHSSQQSKPASGSQSLSGSAADQSFDGTKSKAAAGLS